MITGTFLFNNISLSTVFFYLSFFMMWFGKQFQTRLNGTNYGTGAIYHSNNILSHVLNDVPTSFFRMQDQIVWIYVYDMVIFGIKYWFLLFGIIPYLKSTLWKINVNQLLITWRSQRCGKTETCNILMENKSSQNILLKNYFYV